MQVRFFGGLSVHDGEQPVVVRGRGQEALLFRLAIDTGTTVGYRALAEDVWPDDLPVDPRASLQSLASRLRRALPADALEATAGGYRLTLDRREVDVTHFQDLVAHAGRATDAAEVADLVDQALALWTGEPWVPDGFDWVIRDLLEDRARVEKLRASAAGAAASSVARVVEVIPAPLTPLVGRRRELALIADQLAAERLVTLIGPGGAGKTTLALETARAHGAAVVVELAPAAPGEVWAAVAAAAGRSIRVADTTASATTPRQRALESLAGRPVLIVFDNCEHLSAEAAAVALELLHATAAARVLATSREPLGVAGEAFVDLGPLPDGDAVELFSRRVRAARGSAPTPAESDTVERIVRRLDGLPLALELAAARARVLTLAEIDEGLDDRFALLATGPRTSDPRHQTLRALIDWSWETLGQGEREALLAASVFPDGIVAADAVVVARRFETNASAFESLVDRSLLRRDDGGYRMLETVREYGLDRLRATGREGRARARHAQSMAELALARDALLRGPHVRAGLKWFDANEENLTAALRTCTEQPRLHPTGVELVRATLWESIMRERFERLEAGITAFSSEDGTLDSEAAVVVDGVATIFRTVSAAMQASADGAATAELSASFDRTADRIVQAAAQHPSELTAVLPPLFAGASEAIARTSGESLWSRSFRIPALPSAAPEWTRAFVSMMRSALAQNSGDVETLGSESERAVHTFRALGDVWATAFSSQMRSEWLMLEGRLEEALELADAATADLVGLTSVTDALQQRAQGVNLLIRLGRLDDARARVADVDRLARADGSDRALAQSRMSAAVIEIAAGDGEAALAHLDVVSTLLAPDFPGQVTAWALSKRAQALLLSGRADEAAEAITQGLPLAQRSGDQPIIADVALSLAGWLALTGQDAAARRALDVSAARRGRADTADPFHRFVTERLAPGHDDAAPDLSGAASDELDSLAALLPQPSA
ncbi:ATP-binding protein [Microbacterium sp. P5_E9]